MSTKDSNLASQVEPTEDFVAPRNDLEQRIAEVWQNVMNLEKVGIHDNYFALGGDSLLLIRVLHKFREENMGLELNDLYQLQTVAELAEHVSKRSTDAKPHLQAVPSTGATPNSDRDDQLPAN